MTAAIHHRGCNSDERGIIIWTAGQRDDPNNTASKFVWKQKHGVDMGTVYKHVSHGTVDKEYIKYDMRYKRGWAKRSGGNCLALLSGLDYGWAKASCEQRNCFICEKAMF